MLNKNTNKKPHVANLLNRNLSKNLFLDIASSKAGKEQLCNDYNFQA